MNSLPLRGFNQSKAFCKTYQCMPSNRKFFRIKNHDMLTSRCVHITGQNYEGTFWEPDKRGGYAKKNELSNYEHIKRGSKMIIPETKKLMHETTEYFSQDSHIKHGFPEDGVTDKYFEFNGPESLEKWQVSSDLDYDAGMSTANLTITSSGTGLFSGNLCTDRPKTGNIDVTGYANLRYIPPLKSFGRDQPFFFAAYTHLVFRVRGDGRNYFVNLHPKNSFDLQWFDIYSYVLYTRGGPYWQETRIPFSKFFLNHKGRVQDDQVPIATSEIKTISFTLMDQNSGPYSLEVDYVGCLRDENHSEEFAYESYAASRYTPRH